MRISVIRVLVLCIIRFLAGIHPASGYGFSAYRFRVKDRRSTLHIYEQFNFLPLALTCWLGSRVNKTNERFVRATATCRD